MKSGSFPRGVQQALAALAAPAPAAARDGGPEAAEVAASFTKGSGADRNLQLAEARYRGLIEQIPAVTFLAQLSGGRNEMYVSPQIESLLGFTQAEWLDDPVLWDRQTQPPHRAPRSRTPPTAGPAGK